MVFYLIGLGLGDPTDITVRGLDIVRNCQRVYLEGYTSILAADRTTLEKFYGCTVTVADREQVEQGSDVLFEGALDDDVALLVVGDPFSATTHTDLALRAHSLGIPFQVVSNASIMTAIGCTGLQLYRFGETVSIPFWQDGWEPESFVEKINKNLFYNLHTLCLLDIKVKEQSLENYLKGRRIFEPPRFLRVHQAAEQLLTAISRRKSRASRVPQETTNDEFDENGDKDNFEDLTEQTVCVAAVRVGTDSQTIIRGTLKELSELDLGEPLHSLVICADLHPIEEEALDLLLKHKTTNSSIQKNRFSLIGLGLGQPSDITVKGLNRVKDSSKIILEGYTSIMDGGVEELEQFLEKKVILADRELVEQNSNEIFNHDGNIVFLVVGDPLSATTHVDLITRALEKNFEIDIVHNASIFNAAGCCGLQLYSYGETVSIPFWTHTWKPDSFYDKICRNIENGWHSLCLLDIKVKEQSEENLIKGKKIYEPPRFMTVSQAAKQLVQIIKDRESCGLATPVDVGHKCVGLARIGTKTQIIATGSLQDMMDRDLGGPLQSLIIVGETHPLEDEYINLFGG